MILLPSSAELRLCLSGCSSSLIPVLMYLRGMLVLAVMASGVMSTIPSESQKIIICWKVTMASHFPHRLPSNIDSKILPYTQPSQGLFI